MSSFSSTKVFVSNGVTCAAPFPSSQPFRAARVHFSGSSSRIVNPPDLTRHASTARAAYSKTAVSRVSAGSAAKRPVPFSVKSLTAPRNRVQSEGRAPVPPFVSTLTLGGGRAASAHPWRTTAAAAFAPSAKPMERRVLFELPGVAAAIAARLKRRLYE